MRFLVFFVIFLFSTLILRETLKMTGKGQGLGIAFFHLSVPTIPCGFVGDENHG
jgi:hypothetical protein